MPYLQDQLLAVLEDALTHDDILIRLASAAGFIASCGSLALLVLARINKRMPDEAPALHKIAEITLICPGCSKKHTLPVGSATCPTCRLELNVQVVEPRCPQCDYSLFMLTSNRCPECGWAITTPAMA